MYAVTGFFAVPLSGRFDFAGHSLSFSAFVWSPVIAQQGIALPFSITKLLMLIGWVYACLYTIQRLQFTPLVPARAKTPADYTAISL